MNYELNFSDEILFNRISVALTKIELNEFYASFKYLRNILFFIIKQQDDSLESIQNSLTDTKKKFNIVEKTLIASLNKIFNMCKDDFFKSSPLYKKIRLNYNHKIRIMVNYVLKEIKKKSMTL